MEEWKYWNGSRGAWARRELSLMTRLRQSMVVSQPGKEDFLVLDEASTAADTAIFLADLVRRVRSSSATQWLLHGEDCFLLNPWRSDEPEYKQAAGLKADLGRALKVDTQTFREYFPEHTFHPGTSVACDAIEQFQLRGDMQGTLSNVRSLARMILQLANSPKYVEMRRRHSRARAKRVRQTKDYIGELFRQRSRLLAVRIDLGYRIGVAPDGRSLIRASLTFRQVWRHRKNFFQALRTCLGDKLRGYVARLEWAPHKGYHFHVLVLLDGHQAQNTTGNAKQIGELWRAVTLGLGEHWEPEPHKGDARGTGMFRQSDARERAGLIKAATYLCKADYYIGFYKGTRDKTFFRGNLSQPGRTTELRHSN